MRSSSVIFAFVFTLLFARSAFAWGVEGHALVAQLAFERLSPAAQKAVLNYISPYTSVLNVSSQADDYDHTSAGRWSAPLHYVNMPKGATAFSEANDCPDPPSCVVQAILNYTAILQHSLINPDWRDGEPSPLAFLIHFVGDVHQPLHMGYSYDDAGNEVQVRFFETYTNLHEVWDGSIITKWQSDLYSALDELQEMISSNNTLVSEALSSSSPAVWGTESFQYVRFDVYNFDGEEEFVQDAPPKPFSSTPYLGTDYYDHNLPIIKTQLIRGGVRLAQLLEELFSNL
eukprot:TRINITY_DN8660_c0_g2_i2.p1 TRINITY_DN8660_c0_g2~~TRINITY_DN8660_c0_g2_i2.p1  ORF type:complete len:287 (+),score=58.98 TRINITY_DN8660_c0_g2_i2:108-968(+)